VVAYVKTTTEVLVEGVNKPQTQGEE